MRRPGSHRSGSRATGRELARDDRRADASRVPQDLEEVAALGVLGWGEAPVVNKQDAEAGEFGEQADVGAVGPGPGSSWKWRGARR